MAKPVYNQTPTKIQKLSEELEKAKGNPEMIKSIEEKLKGFHKTVNK